MVCKKVMSPDYLLQLTFSVFSAGKSQQHRSPTEDAEPGRGRPGPESSKLHLSPPALHKRRASNELQSWRFPRHLATLPPPPAPATERRTLAAPDPDAAEVPLSLRGGRRTEECRGRGPRVPLLPLAHPGGRPGRAGTSLPPAQVGPAPLPPAPSPTPPPRPEARRAPRATQSPPTGPGGRRSHLGGVVRAGPGPLARFSRAAAVPIQNGGWGRALAPRPFPSPVLSRGGGRGGSEGAECARSCRAPAEGPSPNQSAGPRGAGQSAPCDLGGGHPAALSAEPKPRAIGREGLKSFLLPQPIRAP